MRIPWLVCLTAHTLPWRCQALIYYFRSDAFPVFLLTVYAKNQKGELDDLTKAGQNELKALAPLLVKKYGKARLQ